MRMINRSRFDETIEVPTASCVNCGATRPVDVMLFDEQAEHFVCDRECFDEWHDANQEEVGDYYFEMNIEN